MGAVNGISNPKVSGAIRASIYTDATGIIWSGELTQEDQDEKDRSKSHPIGFVSGQFRGSQLNWLP